MAEQAVRAEAAGQAEPARVYIIDDDVELCHSVAWLLASIDIDSVVCHRGDDFLDRYDGSHPACLILDVRMPGLSGTRVQEELNAYAPHAAVIFVTAHGDIPMSVSALKAGAVDFLEKPYDPQRLLDSVQEGMRTAAERHADWRAAELIRERLEQLTSREREVLHLVAKGLASQQIATRTGMSAKTVDVHRTRIKQKSGAESIHALVTDIATRGVEIPSF